jgi:hypothetical protein
MDSIVENFIQTFIVKEKRKRSRFEIENGRAGFTNKLNHKIEELFDMRKLVPTEGNTTLIKDKMKIGPKTKCYVICHDDAIDGSIHDFNLAFDQLFGNGLGFCLINLENNTIYVEGEHGYGSTNR